VLWHCASSPEQLAAHRPALLAGYVEHVLNAKTPQDAARLSAYGHLLAGVTHDEFSSTLLPAAQRMVKRSPDVTLPTVAMLCRCVRLDLSTYTAALAELLTQLCRHAKEPVRCGALRPRVRDHRRSAQCRAIAAAA
jgi:hypothetical protein